MPTRILASALLFVVSACSDHIVSPDDASDEFQENASNEPLLLEPEYWRWVWSGDGSHIIYFTRFEYPYTGPRQAIKAIQVTGLAGRTLLTVPAERYFWNGNLQASVDGNFVYYVLSDGTDSPNELHQASIRDAAGSQLVGSGLHGLGVSPDQNSVVEWDPPRSTVLRVLDLRTRTFRSVTSLSSSLRFRSWSPDGRYLLFEGSGITAQGMVYSWVDVASGAVSSWVASRDIYLNDVEQRRGLVPLATWENGHPVLYRMEHGTVIRYDMVTQQRQALRIITGGTGVLAEDISWAPDGRRLGYWRSECVQMKTDFYDGPYCARYKHSLHVFSWSDGSDKVIVAHTDSYLGTGAPMVFSPSGREIAYYRSGGSGLYVAKAP